MSGEDFRRRPDDDDDEIEILEIVGLDDDDTPMSRDGRADDDAEIDVVFDDAEVGPRGDEPDRDTTSPGDADLRDRHLRLQAEFENLTKRVEREKEDFFVHATGHVVARLLPVLDNFERAILHAIEDPATGGAFLDGVRLIHKQLLDELVKQGLRPVEAIGKPFDPSEQEAVATEPDGSVAPNTVLMEYQRGYFFRNRLLRPAMVKVSVPVEEPLAESVPEDDTGRTEG